MTQAAQTHLDDLITVKEACRMLRISRRTFCRLREQSRLPPPVVEASRTMLRWRRGDLLLALSPTPVPHTEQGQTLIAFSHAQAAAKCVRAGLQHLDTLANSLRQLAAQLVNPTAIAASPSGQQPKE